ncbi:UNVERIFIED_CONTAM: hypothetical protein PYX00_001059 [Menopon gallinae]|uniref:tRNA (guanine(26)-N(2))-dimethyltransferase n=1 Tax=Menopon gallinae TaxID=328185 RepID=A0AAW2ICN8_9NEOP
MSLNSPVEKKPDVDHDSGGKLFKEGAAEIKIRDGVKVFYNPVQEFNRDLSISVLEVASSRYYKDVQDREKNKFRILDALSATGLRSIRFAKEIQNVTEIVANDISALAVQVVEENIRHNNVENTVKCSNLDAVEIMFKSRHPGKKFHAVDLDPYGCPSQFLEGAVQCVEDGGLLLVTCTDMAVLCGNGPETSFTKYGSISLKIGACHEYALRVVLYCIQSYASKHKKYIEPMISISVDFYVRVIVRIFTSAQKCKEITSKLSMLYNCTGCGTMNLQPLGIVNVSCDENQTKRSYKLPPAPVVDKLCSHCNGKHQLGGPIWTGNLHDLDFLKETISVVESKDLKTKNRLIGVLNMIMEELNDVPLYYDAKKLSSTLGTTNIPMLTLRSAIMNGGYRVSYSHANKTSIKTDAPMSFIWDIFREWVKQNPTRQRANPQNSPAYNILSKPIENKIDFSHRDDANPVSRRMKLLRFQMNPAPFWGPGSKSKAGMEHSEKKIRSQNKKKRRALDELGRCETKKQANTAQ